MKTKEELHQTYNAKREEAIKLLDSIQKLPPGFNDLRSNQFVDAILDAATSQAMALIADTEKPGV